MEERASETQPSYLDPERISSIGDVLSPKNVGKRLAFLIVGEDPRGLSKPVRKELGRKVAEFMSDLTPFEYDNSCSNLHVDGWFTGGFEKWTN